MALGDQISTTTQSYKIYIAQLNNVWKFNFALHVMFLSAADAKMDPAFQVVTSVFGRKHNNSNIYSEGISK